jgi:hypothetical protein
MIWGGAPNESDCASNGGAWLEVGHTPHGALAKESMAEFNNLVNQPKIVAPGVFLLFFPFPLYRAWDMCMAADKVLLYFGRCPRVHGREQQIPLAHGLCASQV